MPGIPARARVVLTAAVTWLVVAATVVQIIVDEIADELPAGWQDDFVAIAGRVVAVLGAVVAIIRRVSPVPAPERGLLPKEN